MSLASEVDPMAVRTTAVEVAADQPAATGGGASHRQVAALHRYVNENVTYVPDPAGEQYVAPPAETLATGAGDCDCQATLVASLVEAVGVSTRVLRVGSTDGNWHALAEVLMADSIDGTASVDDELTGYYDDVGYTYDTYTYAYDTDGDGQVWYPADTAMGRYLGDIGQLSDEGYVHGPEPDGSWSWHDVEYFYP